MEKLLSIYQSYEPTKECWLDGRYIDAVFEDYIAEPIKIRIQCSEESGCRTNLTGPQIIDTKMMRVRLEVNEMKHSNMILITNDEVLRFEPMLEHEFSPQINKILERYFAKNLPNRRYRELNIHPQIEDEDCPNQGMCVAYVIKAGVLFLTKSGSVENRLRNLDGGIRDIKKFSAAVEDLYRV